MDRNDHTDAELDRRELAYEMSGDTLESIRFERWCSDVEALMGIDDLDGDDAEDGYSLDEAHGLFLNHTVPSTAAFYFIQKMQERRA